MSPDVKHACHVHGHDFSLPEIDRLTLVERPGVVHGTFGCSPVLQGLAVWSFLLGMHTISLDGLRFAQGGQAAREQATVVPINLISNGLWSKEASMFRAPVILTAEVQAIISLREREVQGPVGACSTWPSTGAQVGVLRGWQLGVPRYVER